MMQLHDLDVKHLRDIPGYKAILKAVLKSQIQILVEQLADHTGEESILLTASVADGTLCHLGSGTGKHFIDGRDEIKSQFLSFCLKKQDKRPSQESPAQAAPGNRGMGGPRPRHPQPMGQHNRSFPHNQRVHPVSLARGPAGNRFRSDLHKRSFPSSSQNQQDDSLIPPPKQMKLPIETFPNPYMEATSPPVSLQQQQQQHQQHQHQQHQQQQQHQSPSHSLARTDSQDSSQGRVNIQQIDLSDEARKVKQERTTFENADNDLESSNMSETHAPSAGQDLDEQERLQKDTIQFDTSQTDTTQSMDPDLSNLISSIPSVPESNSSSDGQPVVKIEPVTEGELELEITGVEMGASGDNNSWMPNVSAGQQGFPGMNTSGSDLDMSGANQSGMSQRRTVPTFRHATYARQTSDYGALQGPSYIESSTGTTPMSAGGGDIRVRPINTTTSGPSMSLVECEECGKMLQMSYIKQHQLIHRGEKPYSCQYCNKRFTQANHLKNHEIVHTGEKPFQCNMCGKRFTRKSQLKCHSATYCNRGGIN